MEQSTVATWQLFISNDMTNNSCLEEHKGCNFLISHYCIQLQAIFYKKCPLLPLLKTKQLKLPSNSCYGRIISDLAIFVLKRDVKLQLTAMGGKHILILTDIALICLILTDIKWSSSLQQVILSSYKNLRTLSDVLGVPFGEMLAMPKVTRFNA